MPKKLTKNLIVAAPTAFKRTANEVAATPTKKSLTRWIVIGSSLLLLGGCAVKMPKPIYPEGYITPTKEVMEKSETVFFLLDHENNIVFDKDGDPLVAGRYLIPEKIDGSLTKKVFALFYKEPVKEEKHLLQQQIFKKIPLENQRKEMHKMYDMWLSLQEKRKIEAEAKKNKELAKGKKTKTLINSKVTYSTLTGLEEKGTITLEKTVTHEPTIELPISQPQAPANNIEINSTPLKP